MYSLVDDFTEFFRKYYVRHDEDESEETVDVADVPEHRIDAPVKGRPAAPVGAQPEPVGARRVRTPGPSGLAGPQPEPEPS